MIPAHTSVDSHAGRSMPVRRALLLATIATLAVFVCQWASVHANYQGNWTALYCTAELRALPPTLDQGTYRFTGSRGYDGQMYRLVAHDPWLQKGYHLYLDDAGLRYRRILIPALAWSLALGQSDWIDTTYITIILLSVFTGTFWLTALFHQHAIPDLWALIFPLLPGSLISIDRMTVDIALFALIAALLVTWQQDKPLLTWLLLALCPLVRDLGFLVLAAAIFDTLRRRQFVKSLIYSTAAIPAAAWYLHLRSAIVATPQSGVSAEIPRWAFRDPGYGIFIQMFNPFPYALPHPIAAATQILDFVAFSAIIAAVLIAIIRFPWSRPELRDWIILLFAALYFLASSRGFWRDLYSFGRAFTPLVGLLAFRAYTGGRRWEALPLLGLTLRVIWQCGKEVEGVIRAALRLCFQ